VYANSGQLVKDVRSAVQQYTDITWEWHRM